MAELRWKTPVPLQGQIELERLYLRRLATWLSEQEQEAEYSLEASIALGGPGVAERLFGFEGLITPSPPDTTTILSAPTGARKKIVIGLHVQQVGIVGTFNVVKNKNSVISIIVEMDSADLNHEEIVGQHKSGYIVLDATDESLEIRTLAGTAEISFSGSFLDVE